MRATTRPAGPPGDRPVGAACARTGVGSPLGTTFSEVRVVGVTGTNGKTTTCALLASIFEAYGWQPASSAR